MNNTTTGAGWETALFMYAATFAKYKYLVSVENGCNLNPVGDLATSLVVRWQPDPGGFSFCLGVPIQVAGQRIQNKSVTPYFSQSEKGTQPRGGGKFPPDPWKGTGGIMKEEKKEVPR